MMVKKVSGTFFVMLLGILVLVYLPITGTSQKKAGEKQTVFLPKKADTDARVVGTVIFPPRSTMQRKSSAKELFAVHVTKPGAMQTITAEEITDKALDYIRRTQGADGSWGDKRWPQNVGVTALCCLALFSEGSLPRRGLSGRHLARGLEFLLDHCKDDGQIVARDTYRLGPMYGHSWATLCLLQAYGNMPWRHDMRDKISRALQVLVQYQHVDGGWRYKMTKEGRSDILVTVNVLFALRLGVRAGFAVPRETFDRALTFVGERALKKDGKYTGYWEYLPQGQPGSTTATACGTIGIYMAAKEQRDYDDPRITSSLELLDYIHRRYTVQDLLETQYLHYGAFYVSQAMYHAGDKHWHPYYKKMLKVFAASQQSEGQFADHMGNTVYPTAAVAIVLQAPKGYLPLYLR